MINESVAKHTNPEEKQQQKHSRHQCDMNSDLFVSDKHNFSLRVCVAEDEEGTSLWDRSDLLLLYQVGDDRPRPRWDFRILLLRCSVVIVLLLLLKRKQEICNV